MRHEPHPNNIQLSALIQLDVLNMLLYMDIELRMLSS